MLSCSAIDTALQITTDGQVKPCCPGAYPLGSLRTTPIDLILSSNIYTLVRTSIIEGKSDYCTNCNINDSLVPNSSQRATFNQHFPSPGYQQLKQLDIRWSNLCNLTCRYCNASDSSEWAKLRGIPLESISRDYAQGVFDLVQKNRDSIQVVYLLGGEPLLQKYNEELLDCLGPNTHIDIITNLNVNLDTNRVYQKLHNFSNIIWNLSFDNIGDKFEYVRHGSSWDLLLLNIERLKQDFGLGRIVLHPVYSIWNAVDIQELIDFSQQLGVEVRWQLANEDERYPELLGGFSVFAHNDNIKSLARAHINSLSNVDRRSQLFFNNIKQSLISSDAIPNRAQHFLMWTAKMEQLLPSVHTFENLWPELNTLLLEG